MTERKYRVRDPIHGLIELSETEVKLIDTKVFQRLRRIRQLAMASLVYPSALHTRFEHSIGVMHIAGRICTELQKVESNKITAADIKLVRIAALLHDVGHGPFSHVSEDLLERYARDQTGIGETREKIHEQITVDFIQTDPEIRSILDDDEEREFVVTLIKEKDMRDWRRNVISSELDADKMDYLLRDSYFAGVQYGQYDLEQIIESCRIDTDRNTTSLVMSSAGIYALEQLLLARYHMTQQVYWHKVSLISNQMIIRGITLAIKGGNSDMKELYQYDENDKENFIQRYLNYHDEKVIDLLRHCEQEKVSEIFNRLYDRRLFKTIAELPLKEVEAEDARSLPRLLEMTELQKQQWEQEIANYLGIDATDVIVHKRQIRNPDYGRRSKILDSESIRILDEKRDVLRHLRYYDSELSFVRPPGDDASLETVQVYASPDGWNLSKNQTPSELETDIRNILCSR